MKKQSVCEYCGKIFEEKFDKEGYANNYKMECVKHEITHLDLEEKFRTNLIHALIQLDIKYNSSSIIEKIEVNACWDSYYGKDITYTFRISNDKINNTIESEIEVYYENKEKVPTSNEIISQLEHHFFIPTINQKYEGIFRFEGFCGGDGADDFIIGESYMKTIYKAFEGKKVRIEVID